MSNDEDNIVLYRRTPRGLPRANLRRFAERIRAEVAGGRRFTVLLTDDRELQRLNREFLDKDYPTDVLSFPAGEISGPDMPPELPVGEMAISVERAGEQAAQMGHSLEEEINVLMLHGLLHLLGMNHEKDRGKMARAEKRWREKLELPTALIERAHR